jgi:hypothetical protein
MKKNKLIIAGVLAVSIFLQIAAFCNAGSTYFQNGFAIGVDNTAKHSSVVFSLVYILLPLIFVLFFFSGSIYQITHGYEKVLIVRNYSKTKLLLKRYLKNFLSLVAIVLFQCVAFMVLNRFLVPVPNGMAKSIIMYFIILHAVIMLQSLLELFMPPQNSYIFLFIYCFLSYYIVQIFTDNIFAKIALFPCLMFGMQNGAVESQNVFYVYLTMGILLNLLLTFICLLKFKKTDIF